MDFAKFSEARVTTITEGSKAGTQVRCLSYNDDVTVIHNVRPKGAVFPPHVHEAAQLYMVLKGKIELTAGDETKILEDGDTWFVPGNVPHGAVILEDTVECEIFVPGRQDLVDKYY